VLLAAYHRRFCLSGPPECPPFARVQTKHTCPTDRIIFTRLRVFVLMTRCVPRVADATPQWSSQLEELRRMQKVLVRHKRFGEALDLLKVADDKEGEETEVRGLHSR
jgi:hypothetical protein